MHRILALALLLGGCAYTSQTTVVAPMGGDTYSVGASSGKYVAIIYLTKHGPRPRMS